MKCVQSVFNRLATYGRKTNDYLGRLERRTWGNDAGGRGSSGPMCAWRYCFSFRLHIWWWRRWRAHDINFRPKSLIKKVKMHTPSKPSIWVFSTSMRKSRSWWCMICDCNRWRWYMLENMMTPIVNGWGFCRFIWIGRIRE